MKILESFNLVSVAEPDAKRISRKGPILVLIGIIVAVALTLLAHELDRKIQPPYYHALTDSYCRDAFYYRSTLSFAVSLDGRMIVAGDALGRVHFLRLVEADKTKPSIGDAKIRLLHHKEQANLDLTDPDFH